MAYAETSLHDVLAKVPHDLHSAAASYRLKRGRHPPPGFDVWYQRALRHKAVIVEDLFNQIYRDLTPFWSIAAKDMRDFARHSEHRIFIRNSTANMTLMHDQGTQKDRMEACFDLIQGMATLLPDLDMAVNIMDESRVIVPWENIDKYVRSAEEAKELVEVNEVLSQYQSYAGFDEGLEVAPEVSWISPGEEPFWDTARVGCAPQAPARYKAATTNFTGPPPMPPGYPMRSLEGYVKNWTYARDPYQQRHLQESHGTFVEPISVSNTRQLVPIFGESKLSMNNDILIPPAAYLSESFSSGQYSDIDTHGGGWSDKIAGVIWRGVASGGRNREENWTRFHRHRFVLMLNGSYVQNIETDSETTVEGQSFIIPSYATY